MEIVIGFLLMILGLLLGGIFIPRQFKPTDLKVFFDDLNPGTFNAFKNCGIKIGIICFTLNFLKGFVPVFLASLFLKPDNIYFSLMRISKNHLLEKKGLEYRTSNLFLFVEKGGKIRYN